MRSGLYFISAVVLCIVGPAFGALCLTANGEDVEYLDLLTYYDEAMIGIVTEGSEPVGLNQAFLSITGNSEVGLWTGHFELFAPECPPIEPCQRIDEYTWLISWDGVSMPMIIAEAGYMSNGYASYDVHVTLFDTDMNQLDRIFISQTPEPATLALFGLGGLLIRRK